MKEADNLTVPNDFKYRKILDIGKPVHNPDDPFYIRHPKMDLSRRAKIFAPFDALRGFDAAVIAKNEIYENRRDPDNEILEEIGQTLSSLHRLTKTGSQAGSNSIRVSVTFFMPCPETSGDPACEERKYCTITGACLKVDPDIRRSIMIDDIWISFKDKKSIEILESYEQTKL